MVDRSNQLDVAEVTGAVNLRTHASFAKAVFVHGAHQIVIDGVGDWITILLIGRLLVDLGHR